jgi:hypothetical protein
VWISVCFCRFVCGCGSEYVCAGVTWYLGVVMSVNVPVCKWARIECTRVSEVEHVGTAGAGRT